MQSDLLRYEDDNLGGLLSISFLPVEGVASIPATVDGEIHHRVQVNSGYRWFECYCTEQTMDYKEEPQTSDHGTAYKKSCSGILPKDRPEITAVLEDMKHRRYILDIQFASGLRKLVGTVDEPMYVAASFNSSKAVSGRNAHEVVFSGEGIKKSPFYTV